MKEKQECSLSFEEHFKKFKELNGNKRKFNNLVTYKLWAETSGFCAKCNEELLEFYDDYGINGKNLGQRAHIISLNSTNFRAPIACWYGEELTKKLGLKQKEESCFYDPESLNNHNNLLLLCKQCHKEFDVKMNKKNEHVDSAQEMSDLKGRASTEIINNAKFRVSGHRSIDGTFKIMSGFLDMNLKNTKNNFKCTFLAIKELNKYLEFPSETALIMNINKVIDVPNSKKTINKIKDIIEKYFDGNKDNKDKGSKNIECFLFEIQVNTEQKLLNLTISTRSKNDEKYQGKIDDKISNLELREKISKELERDDEYNLERERWVLNGANPIKKIKEQREYKLLDNLLMQSLQEYSTKGDSDSFNSFSVAYMARWGTGKTTLIKTLASERTKYFRFVDINLWHIANSVQGISDKEDNLFIRNIVKEALTQMSNDRDVVSNYVDAMKIQDKYETGYDLASKAISDATSSLLQEEKSTIVTKRDKFIDQFIFSLSKFVETLFRASKKPIVFIFDDLDRVTKNEHIIKILDALVAFLNIKNCVFIIPVDESKIIKALYEQRKSIDPNQFINKYFNYSIKAPFIPHIERRRAFEEIVASSNLEGLAKDEYLNKIIPELINPTYRDIKEFINLYKNNKYLFNYKGNPLKKFFKKKETMKGWKHLFVLATLMQMNFPLFTDYLAEDIGRHRALSAAIKEIITLNSYLQNPSDNDDSSKNKKTFANSRSYKLWSALSGATLSPKHFQSDESFVQAIRDDKNETSNWENRLMTITDKIILYNKILGIEKFSQVENILLWAIITQSKLYSKNIVSYGKLSHVHTLLMEKNKENIIELAKSISTEDFDDYFEKIDEFIQSGILHYSDKNDVLKNAFDNISDIMNNLKEVGDE